MWGKFSIHKETIDPIYQLISRIWHEMYNDTGMIFSSYFCQRLGTKYCGMCVTEDPQSMSGSFPLVAREDFLREYVRQKNPSTWYEQRVGNIDVQLFRCI
jgi:hypothetical protein